MAYFSKEWEEILKSDESLLPYAKFSSVFQWSNYEKNKLKKIMSSQINNQLIDWTEISLMMNRSKSPIECYMMYRNGLSPDINNSPWQPKDIEILTNHVNQFGDSDWVRVSQAVNNNKTPLQCLQIYQQVLNKSFLNQSFWTEEEDKLLIHQIRQFGLNDWSLISRNMPFRNETQCFRRFKYSLLPNIKSGKWDDIEERKLILALISCEFKEVFIDNEVVDDNNDDYNCFSDSDNDMDEENTNDIEKDKDYINNKIVDSKKETKKRKIESIKWNEVAKIMKNRDEIKCREKYFNHLMPELSCKPFTKEEDSKILAICNKDNIGNWAQLAKEFPGRTDCLIMRRWNYLTNNKLSHYYHLTKKAKQLKKTNNVRNKIEMENISNNDFVLKLK